ncbi:MAG: hypothetical protein M3Z11_03460 [Candidatus Dormibacteraeota bacterium]|nr:hypothetical protein [Candidatus Dormibacteraeota bacterium]
MTTDTRAADVAIYAAGVRAALGDMREEERVMLLEDLDDHLAEIAAEADGTLAERLGPPAQYAAELRAAYGTSHPNANRRTGPVREIVDGLRAGLGQSGWYRDVRAFLPSLRPAWWVFRGYSAALLLTLMFRSGYNVRPIPNPFHARGLVQLILTAVAIVLSVRVGQRFNARSDVTRLLGILGNTAIAVLIIGMLGSMSTNAGYVGGDVVTQGSNFAPQSVFAGGGVVTNIYPYSKDGKPLTDVLLFDQNGQPLTVDSKAGGVESTYPLGSDGQSITNAYPLTQRNIGGPPVARPRVALPPWPPPLPGPSPTTTP